MLNGMRGSNSHWFPHLMGWSIYLHRNVIHCSNETSSIKVETTMGSSCQNLFEASHCLFRTTLLKSPFHECMISNIIKNVGIYGMSGKKIYTYRSFTIVQLFYELCNVCPFGSLTCIIIGSPQLLLVLGTVVDTVSLHSLA